MDTKKGYNYEPHISLANMKSPDIQLDDYFYMIVDKVLVEKIGENDESIKLFEVELGKNI